MSESQREHQRVPLLQQSPLLLALVLLWMLLWGSVTPLTIVTGVVVALVVTRAFYLPPVELSGRFNPWWFLVLLGRFAVDLVRASFEVAWQALRPRGVERNAVIRVDLTTRNDFVLTGTALAVSLVPGSVVLEVDRPHSVLYIHSLGIETPEQVACAHDAVLAYERRILRALGSREEWEAVR
ncbi:Na+/H+ antiporter subunit E [Microcella daejeonensis]|uniref:Na+/H+ antiporter subunit E n=1 Tax=Microcella daejeonensis TaxID=2994971 RepID=A0A9E8MLH3_9MICO|nr:Na+/H+ antiporter subunit E [Microcella daejeonensis]WAB81810.1 Na+/H+ antiporter subunit E [Microcella daejeonensis]